MYKILSLDTNKFLTILDLCKLGYISVYPTSLVWTYASTNSGSTTNSGMGGSTATTNTSISINSSPYYTANTSGGLTISGGSGYSIVYSNPVTSTISCQHNSLYTMLLQSAFIAETEARGHEIIDLISLSAGHPKELYELVCS